MLDLTGKTKFSEKNIRLDRIVFRFAQVARLACFCEKGTNLARSSQSVSLVKIS